MVAGLLIGLRLLVLTGERVSFHALGKGLRYGGAATAWIAYVGAALVLTGIAAATGQLAWVGAALVPGCVYAVSYALYSAALAQGPLSMVSAWSNAVVLWLYLTHPTGGALSWVGLSVFISGGAVLLLGKSSGSHRGTLLMVLSTVALALGRHWDALNHGIPLLTYATSMFWVVAALYLGWALASGRVEEAADTIRERTGWALAAVICNASAYVVLLALLDFFPPAVVEAVSAGASVLAAAAGAWGFREAQGERQFWGSLAMAVGASLLLYDHWGRFL